MGIMMNSTEAIAKLKNLKHSPKKLREVADVIRGMPVLKCINMLDASPKKAAFHLKKVLQSAIANAENNHGLDIDELYVKTVYVDKAFVLKRMRPRARGAANRILKPYSHITLAVAEKDSGVI